MAELRYSDPTGKGYPHGKFEDYYKEINSKIKLNFDEYTYYVYFVKGDYVKNFADDDTWIENSLHKYAFLDFDPNKYYKIWDYCSGDYSKIALIEPYDGPIYNKKDEYFTIEDIDEIKDLLKQLEQINNKLENTRKRYTKPNKI